MSLQPFRIEPALPPGAYMTYQVLAPLSTHFAPASCLEVQCADYLQGWRVHAESLPPELLHAARTSGRNYREVSYGEGQTWLLFDAGQPCFRATEHRRRLDREERFVIRGGDYRANPSGMRTEVPLSSWVDDFGEHQAKLAERLERG